jgi:hypothetical protein
MTRKRNNKRQVVVGRHFWSRPPFWFGVLIVFFGAIIAAWGVYFEKQAQVRREAQARERAAANDAVEFAPWDPSWPELPGASGFASHPFEFIRAAYAFAARRPDVVQYLPCYCGCEKQGHQSLQFCFVKKRTPSGIAQWDGMGFT